MVTGSPRDLSSKPKDADAIPFPSEETTPPVIKINFGFRFLDTVHHAIIDEWIPADRRYVVHPGDWRIFFVRFLNLPDYPLNGVHTK